VKRQDYRPLEHIVVDGGSTDGTVEILRRYSATPGWEHLRWVSERDRGQTDAINKGFAMASGEVLAYLCSDDSYAAEAFHFAARFFSERPDVDLVYGGCCFINEKGAVLRRKKPVPFNIERLLRSNCIWQPTVFFQRRLWAAVGPFNEELHFAMDYEYWLRAARTYKFAAVNRYLANYRWHLTSKTVSQEREQLHEGYAVARQFGGSSLYSWFLHHVYWPGTSGIKRRLFSVFASEPQPGAFSVRPNRGTSGEAPQ